MNFLHFLTSASSAFNFNLNSQPTASSASKLQISNSEPSAFKQVEAFDAHPQPASITNDKIESPAKNINYQDIMRERQGLINQFLQLELQLLQHKIMEKEKDGDNDQNTLKSNEEKSNSDDLPESHKKKIKKINKCGHEDRVHYAKGMCNNCYHRFGRVKKPWNCTHQKLYAAGMCQNCYINQYNKKRREEGVHDLQTGQIPEKEVEQNDAPGEK